MSNQNSILDKIIESQEKKQAAAFNANDLVLNLLKNLSSKEGDILSRRFGLLGKEKETLEQIGKYYDITRERIRQVEMATIRKLKDLKDFRNHIDSAEKHIIHLLEDYGGIMEENHLLDEISYQDQVQNQASRFILTHLLNDKIEAVKADDNLLTGWKLPVVSLDLIKQVVNELAVIIEEEKRLVSLADLLKQLTGRDFFRQNQQQILALKLGGSDENQDDKIEQIIGSYLKIAKNIDQNILGEWGKAEWNTISPKRMSDKIFLVLRKSEKPLHFTEITDLINQSNFDRKKAYPATIHNELILDDRYVLVGRGIYALKDWGYQQGTVMDVIMDILAKAGKPLTKEEIVTAVLDQRIVRKSTIFLALTNKEKITRLPDGTYTLNKAAAAV